MSLWRTVRQAISGRPLMSYTAISVALFALFNTSGGPASEMSWSSLTNSHPFTQLSFVNLSLCGLIWIGLFGVRLLFGELRPVEKQELRSHFWHLIITKALIFVGMVHVEDSQSFVVWVSLLSGLCYMLTITRFCQLRFEYGSSSPATPRFVHVKLLVILSVIMVIAGHLVVRSYHLSPDVSESLLAAAECLLLLLASLKSAALCSIHLIDMCLDNAWRQRSFVTYYCDFYLDLALLGLSFAHHLHMLYCSSKVSIFSLATLCITLHLHMSYSKLKQRLLRHFNYQKLTQNLESRFPIASKEEVEAEDAMCAICWDELRVSTARRLPCAHIFHMRCLLQWLEQDATCPTCRLSLSDALLGAQGDGHSSAATPGAFPPMRNLEYTIQGGGWLGWLPRFTFSVRTSRGPAGRFGADGNVGQHQVDASLQTAAARLHDMFPHVSLTAITVDLAQTQSADVTAENIIEGRLVQGQIQNSLHPLLQPSVGAEQSTTVPLSSSIRESTLPEDGETMSALPQHADYQPPQTVENRLSLFPTNANNEVSILARAGQSHTDRNLQETDMAPSHPVGMSGQSSQGERVFSTSGEERHRLLEERRRLMMEKARQSYLSKSSTRSPDIGHSLGERLQPFLSSSSPTPSALAEHSSQAHYRGDSAQAGQTLAGQSAGKSLGQTPATDGLSEIERRRALMLRAAEQRLKQS